MRAMRDKEIIFSGMRPTGRMHIGHYFGALKNWVELQEEYKCIFGITDWHALTTSFEDTASLENNIIEMAADWLAVGIDPEKSTLILQSWVPEHAELHLLFSMITPVGWLERNPVLKEQLQDMGLKEAVGYGHLGYPVLMASDILIYKAVKVPVGEDQVPHIEITREIARRFNYLYGEVFPEPQALLTEAPRILGIDGKKMSKSLNNYIGLSESPEEIRKKVRSMFTDPEKIRLSDAGHPERCNVFSLHRLLTNPRLVEIKKDCQEGKWGCVSCKEELSELMVKFLEKVVPHREKYQREKHLVKEILWEGSKKARQIAQATVKEAKEVMKLNYDF